jgi:UDP-GlcNAc:undecaprenyl-phosphate/decaprenyl-phosphate GlcNAc-1-phosphate transferase
VRPYLVTFFVAAVAALFLTPPVEWVARRIGAVAQPGERKVHTEPVPQIGGVALYLGFLIAIGARLFLDRIGHARFPLLPPENMPQLLGIVIGATIVFAVGLADDIWDLPPWGKFVGQLAAAGVLVYYGVQIEFVGNPFGGGGLLYLGWLAIPLTLFWIVAFTNTVNFMDGLDGLAAGVCGIAAATFFVFAFETGQTQPGILSALVGGLCLGFLWHNFHPARIFMGDSGALFLGFVLSAIAMQGVMKSIAAIAFLVPIVIMGVPIFDTALAIVRRWRKGQSISTGDAMHIHHRLLHRGFSHRQTVLLIWLWSALLSVGGLSLRFAPNAVKGVVFAVLAVLSFGMIRLMGLFEPYDGAHRVGKAETEGRRPDR